MKQLPLKLSTGVLKIADEYGVPIATGGSQMDFFRNTIKVDATLIDPKLRNSYCSFYNDDYYLSLGADHTVSITGKNPEAFLNWYLQDNPYATSRYFTRGSKSPDHILKEFGLEPPEPDNILIYKGDKAWWKFW